MCGHIATKSIWQTRKKQQNSTSDVGILCSAVQTAHNREMAAGEISIPTKYLVLETRAKTL